MAMNTPAKVTLDEKRLLASNILQTISSLNTRNKGILKGVLTVFPQVIEVPVLSIPHLANNQRFETVHLTKTTVFKENQRMLFKVLL